MLRNVLNPALSVNGPWSNTRRVLCNLLGKDMENLSNDVALIGDIVRRLCYRNAEEYLGLGVGADSVADRLPGLGRREVPHWRPRYSREPHVLDPASGRTD